MCSRMTPCILALLTIAEVPFLITHFQSHLVATDQMMRVVCSDIVQMMRVQPAGELWH